MRIPSTSVPVPKTSSLLMFWMVLEASLRASRSASPQDFSNKSSCSMVLRTASSLPSSTGGFDYGETGPRGKPVRDPHLTEDELVRAIRKVLSGEAPGVVVSVGDDAAVVEPGE